MKSEYHIKNRCKYLISIHLILVIKYRKHILKDRISENIKEIILNLSLEPTSKFKIKTMETDLNHIHILLDIEPSVSISSIVSRIKQKTTIEIWSKYFNYLKTQYWNKRMFWSDGYFACSTGNACLQTIENYIKTQG